MHDFFVQDGGAERCILELARLLPQAEVYTSFFDEETFADRIDPARIHTWPLAGRVPSRHFRRFLPLYPTYFSALDLRAARLVVSSSVAFAKAVRTSPNATHVSYVYTPMRYAWDQSSYLRGSSYSRATRVAARAARSPLRVWDEWSARRPDVLVAISKTVQDRIRRRWHRRAAVIYPPVDVSEFKVSRRDDGYLLIAARLLAYRRIELAVEAAQKLGRELVIVGDGPERRQLAALAASSSAGSIRLLGQVDRPTLVDVFERCHAYVLPGEEDFGISPLEAMACGKPVIALGRGGASETVVDGVHGVLFENQSAEGLADAIERVDGISFHPAALRARAEEFDRSRFIRSWTDLLGRLGFADQLRTVDAAAGTALD